MSTDIKHLDNLSKALKAARATYEGTLHPDDSYFKNRASVNIYVGVADMLFAAFEGKTPTEMDIIAINMMGELKKMATAAKLHAITKNFTARILDGSLLEKDISEEEFQEYVAHLNSLQAAANRGDMTSTRNMLDLESKALFQKIVEEVENPKPETTLVVVEAPDCDCPLCKPPTATKH